MMFFLGDLFLLIALIYAIKKKRIGYAGVSFVKKDNPFAFYLLLGLYLFFFLYFFYLALDDLNIV